MSPHARLREASIFRATIDRSRAMSEPPKLKEPDPPPPDSGITPEDLARARQRFREATIPEFRELLEAPTEEKP